MKAEAVSSLLLEGRAGIVTERDLARAFGAGCSAMDPVVAIASRHPVTVPGDKTVTAAAGLMLHEQVRHLLVELEPGEDGNGSWWASGWHAVERLGGAELN